jgi:hypothetical protein
MVQTTYLTEENTKSKTSLAEAQGKPGKYLILTRSGDYEVLYVRCH